MAKIINLILSAQNIFRDTLERIPKWSLQQSH